jgi:DNA-binding transcriptional regulator YiaG
MSTFANQLKLEISRLAKKEVRAEILVLKKASTQYRSEIAALKKRVVSLEVQLKRQSKGRVPVVANESESNDGKGLRFRVGGFAALRKKLNLSATEMAKLLGVSAQSVYHWETGKSKPRATQLQAIAAVRKMGKKVVIAKLSEGQPEQG